MWSPGADNLYAHRSSQQQLIDPIPRVRGLEASKKVEGISRDDYTRPEWRCKEQQEVLERENQTLKQVERVRKVRDGWETIGKWRYIMMV